MTIPKTNSSAMKARAARNMDRIREEFKTCEYPNSGAYADIPTKRGNLEEPKSVDFPRGFVSEILTLLDRIEIKDDASLASQRFEIGEKHGLTVVFGERVSNYDN